MDKLAQIDFDALQDIAAPNFKNATIGYVITQSLPYVMTAAGIALLFYLFSGGFQLMVSRGDPKAVQAGKNKITYAFLGFVIILFAFFIVQIVGLILGISVFGQIF